jgi:hypothetical protein
MKRLTGRGNCKPLSVTLGVTLPGDNKGLSRYGRTGPARTRRRHSGRFVRGDEIGRTVTALEQRREVVRSPARTG